MRKDSRARLLADPVRVLWTDPGSGRIERPEALLDKNESVCTLYPGAGNGPGILVDFGQELNGGVVLDAVNIQPRLRARIRLRFGESVSEAMGQPDADHALHDLSLNIPRVSRQEIGHTGFRFVRIDLLDQESWIAFRQIQAVALERPFDYAGHFECSDPLLNRIWMTGARTVHLCCQDYVYDGIKRDRMVWIADIHPQIHVIASVFGNTDIVPESLDWVRDRTPPNRWMNDISSYSLWWILCTWDWYWYSGDRDYLQAQATYLDKLTTHLVNHIDPSGREKLGGTRFLDWTTSRDESAIAEGLQALFIWAMETAAKIFDELHDRARKEKCQAAANLLHRAPVTAMSSKQVNALQVLAGVSDPVAANRRSLAQEPGQGLSTYYGFYVLQARALAGDYVGCLDLLRSFWGGMLRLGATTFWEHFDEAWLQDAARIDEITPPGKHDVHAEYGDHCFQGLRHSLCHGWAGGPTAWLSRHVLGVQARSPGFRTVAIHPHLGDLAYARGVVPTPAGPIQVEHTRQADGRVVSEWQVPDGIQVAE